MFLTYFEPPFDSLTNQVNNLREELQNKDREFETIEKKYLREICNLKEKLDQSDTRENVLVQEVSSQKSKITELKSNVSSLEQILCIKEDVNRQLDQVSTRVSVCVLVFWDFIKQNIVNFGCFYYKDPYQYKSFNVIARCRYQRQRSLG